MQHYRSGMIGGLLALMLIGQAGAVLAATLFDDGMAALRYLSPHDVSCVEASGGRNATCAKRSDTGMFQAEFVPGQYPRIIVTTLTPGLSLNGMEYTIAFQITTERLGITDGGQCVPTSLASRSMVQTVEGSEYRVDCSARFLPGTKTVESTLVITSKLRVAVTAPPVSLPKADGPARTDSPLPGDWPGEWEVTRLVDGRLYARVEMINDGDQEYGGFSTFGIICARGGGLKIGFETLDGTSHPTMVMEPGTPSPFTLRLTGNEIRGPQADQFLGDLADIEKMVRKNRPDGSFALAFSAYGEADYVSIFDLSGIAEVTRRLRETCAG